MSSRSREPSLWPEDVGCGPFLFWGARRGKAPHMQGAHGGISVEQVWRQGKGEEGLRKGCFPCQMEIKQRGDSRAVKSWREV